jgi:integrase
VRLHTCKPLAASTVRQIHSIISGTLSAVERWGLDRSQSSPRRPPATPQAARARPTDPAEAARLADEAFRMDDDWGTLVWLVMTTGMRRGELCGLRFSRIDFDTETVDVRRNWVNGKEKDTKTHQSRRIALDSETLALLREHRERVKARVEALGTTFSDDLFVFSSFRVACHGHGTVLSGFLPGAWDHPVASDGTTRRVVPWGLVASVVGFLHVVGCGGWCGVRGGLGG